MLTRSKLNSIESKISEALINSEISHKGFKTIINEEEKYRELKQSIRMMNSQRSYVEKINLIEEGKIIDINEVSNHKHKMKSYCLKCKKDTENINPRVSNTGNGKTMLLSKSAKYAVKNQDLLNIKKGKDY